MFEKNKNKEAKKSKSPKSKEKKYKNGYMVDMEKVPNSNYADNHTQGQNTIIALLKNKKKKSRFLFDGQVISTSEAKAIKNKDKSEFLMPIKYDDGDLVKTRDGVFFGFGKKAKVSKNIKLNNHNANNYIVIPNKNK